MWNWEVTLTYAYEGKRGRYLILTDGENGWILSYRDNDDEEHFIAWTRTVIEAQMRAYNFDCE